MMDTENPIIGDEHPYSNFDEKEKSEFDEKVDTALFAIKRAMGSFYYLNVILIIWAPITLISAAAIAFHTYAIEPPSGRVYHDDDYVLGGTTYHSHYSTPKYEAVYVWAVLLSLYAFVIAVAVLAVLLVPDLVFKAEEASYLVKVHFPFLMSSSLEDEILRTVMFDVLRNFRDDCALMIGFSCSPSCMFGNILLFVASMLYGVDGGVAGYIIAIFSFLNFATSFYDFLKKGREARLVTAYRWSQIDSATKGFWCCCLYFLPEDAKKRKEVDEMDLDVGETAKFFTTDLPNPFKSKQFREKYGMKFKEHLLDLDTVQADVPVKDGKPIFEVRDRFGFLSITGDAHLRNLERKDASQASKEDSPGFFSKIFSSITSYFSGCFHPMAACKVIAGECSLFCVTMNMPGMLSVACRWLIWGFCFDDQLKKSCENVAKSKEDVFTDAEIKALRDGTIIRRLNDQMELINRPMPWGLAFLAPLCKNEFIKNFAPLTCKLTKKFRIDSTNIASINTVAEIFLRSNVVIPHDTLDSFPYNLLPLGGWRDSLVIKIGQSLQVVRDAFEDNELARLGLVVPKGELPSPEVVDAIKRQRQETARKITSTNRSSKVAKSMTMDRDTDVVFRVDPHEP